MHETILARIDDAWIDFLPALDALSDEQASEPGVAGYYSVKDILAHLAWWEDHTRQVVETGQDGPIHVEALNDRIYAENTGTSFGELRTRLMEGHARARATFSASDSLTEDDVKDDTWVHREEHGEQIRVWRAAKGI